MMLAKCLILLDHIKQAKEILLYSKGLLDTYINELKINYNQIQDLIPQEIIKLYQELYFSNEQNNNLNDGKLSIN